MTLNGFQGFGACAIAFGLALLPGAGQAQSACSLPVQPVCSTGVTGTDTASSKLRCESDVTKFIADLEAYRGCLDAAGDRARQQIELASRFRDCLKEDRDDCAFNSRR